MPDLTPRESIVLPEFYRSGQAVQVEYRFATPTKDMDVGRPVIIRIYHHPQPVKTSEPPALIYSRMNS